MGIRLYTGEFLRETGLEPFRALIVIHKSKCRVGKGFFAHLKLKGSQKKRLCHPQ